MIDIQCLRQFIENNIGSVQLKVKLTEAIDIGFKPECQFVQLAFGRPIVTTGRCNEIIVMCADAENLERQILFIGSKDSDPAILRNSNELLSIVDKSGEAHHIATRFDPSCAAFGRLEDHRAHAAIQTTPLQLGITGSPAGRPDFKITLGISPGKASANHLDLGNLAVKRQATLATAIPIRLACRHGDWEGKWCVGWGLVRIVHMLGFVLALWAPPAFAGDPFAGRTKEEILQQSMDTVSPSERAKARIYLAKSYPDSVEGRAAQAWLVDRAGEKAKAIKLYEDCLDAYPQFYLCFRNYTALIQDRADRATVVAARSRFEALGKARFEVHALKNLLAVYNKNDKAAAKPFLESNRSAIISSGQGWKLPYLEGVIARWNKDYDSALRLFSQAMAEGGNDFDIWREAAETHRASVSPSSLQTDKALGEAIIKPLVQYIRDHPDQPGPVLYLADFMKSLGGAPDTAIALYKTAFDIEPHPEVIATIASLLVDDSKKAQILNYARERLPDDPLVDASYAEFLMEQRLDFNQGRSLFEGALTRMADDIMRQPVAKKYAQLLEDFQWDWDHARDVRLRYGVDANREADSLILNRFRAGDYRAARAIVTDPAAFLHPDYREIYRERIDEAEANATRYKTALPYLSFLNRWNETPVADGGSVERTVWFAPGSSALTAKGEIELNDVARLLKEAGSLITTIELAGFADANEGDDPVPLSQQRANAVLARLQALSGIPGEKFTTLALGSRFVTHGPADNRRVTITPLASFGETEVFAPVSVGPRNVAVAPDGRFLLLGAQSQTIVDLANDRVIARLGRGGGGVAFSPNGRMIAMTTGYIETGGYITRGLFIYDRLTGLRLHTITFANWSANFFSWSPDSSAVVFVDPSGIIYVYDLSTRSLRWVARPNTRSITGRIAWSPDGASIAFAPAEAHQAFILDARSGAVSRTLTGVDWPLSLAWSPDGSRLALADNRSIFHLWDTSNWSHRTTQFTGHPSAILRLDGVAQTAYQAVTTDQPDGQRGATLVQIDLASLNVVAARPIPRDTSIVLDGWAERIYFVADDINVFKLSDFSLIQKVIPESTRLTDSVAPNNCACIVSTDSGGIHVWSAATGRKIHSFDEVAKSLFVLPNGQVVIGLVGNRLFRFNLATYLAEDLGPALTGGGIAQRLSAKGELIAVGGVSDPRDDSAVVEVRQGATLKLLNRLTFPVVTEPKNYPGLFYSQLASLDIDAIDRRIIATTAWSDGFGRGMTASREARVFDIATGSMVFRLRQGRYVDWVRFEQRDGKPTFLLGSDNWVLAYDDEGKALDSIKRGDLVTRGTRGDREFTVARTGTLSIEIDWLADGNPPIRVTAGEDLQNYYAIADLNLLLIVRLDNSFSYYDLETGELALTLVAQRNSEWLAYTPQGVYAASQNGAKGASLAFGTVLRPLEANAETLESRKIVAESLARVRHDLLQTDQAPAGATARLVVPLTVPYRLELTSPAKMVTQTSSLTLEFRVTKHNPEDPDPTLVFDLNGQRFSNGAIATTDANGTFVQSFPLEPGRNFVQAALSYGGATFNPVTALVERSGANDSQPGQNGRATVAPPRPRLFVLGIGVSEYQNASMNLKYADKDVRTVATLLEAQKGTLFSDVRLLLLTNEQVRSEDVRIKGLREFLTQATSEDVIVIYLAGHGAQAADGSLFLLSHNTDFDKPHYGIEMSWFRDFLLRRPVGQKAIMFMDMCQAGSLAMEETGARGTRLGASTRVTSDDIGNLLNGTGTIIFASSKGASPSYESAEWDGGHGAFTAAVLRALRGEADGGHAKADGLIDVLELQSYILKTVPQLTGKRQEPTIVGSSNISPYALTKN